MNLSIEIPPLGFSTPEARTPESFNVIDVSRNDLISIKTFLDGFRRLVAVTQTLKWRENRLGVYIDQRTVLGQYTTDNKRFLLALLTAAGLFPPNPVISNSRDAYEMQEDQPFWRSWKRFEELYKADLLRGSYKLIQDAFDIWALTQQYELGPMFLEERVSLGTSVYKSNQGWTFEQLQAIPKAFRPNFAALPRNIGNLLYDALHTPQLEEVPSANRTQPRVPFRGLRIIPEEEYRQLEIDRVQD